MLYQLCSESSEGKMNSCYNSRMSERRRNVLKCFEMFCNDTLEERAMNVICMKYPFLLIPGLYKYHHIYYVKYVYGNIYIKPNVMVKRDLYMLSHSFSTQRGLPVTRWKKGSEPSRQFSTTEQK